MLTVLFATRNNAQVLREVLETYCRLQPPPRGWKLVVVDNASTDQSRDIILSFQHRLPLTCLSEETLGKNVALNTGLSAMEGDLVVLTDDDAFPRPDWLVRMRATVDSHPSYAIFGGLVVPRWETAPPAWILAWVPLAPVFALTDPSVAEGPTGSQNVFGPNMAVRAQAFASGHRFDSRIGPRGTSYAMGSESEFVRRLVRQGYAVWHTHDAVVEHFIREFQLQRSWILRRAIRYGRGQYRMAQALAVKHPVFWWGVPRYLFRELFVHAIHVAKGFFSFDQGELFRAQWGFNFVRGEIMEARNLRKERPIP
jgi:glycosyltransferase involved in cell wall biosynthesis